MSLTDLLFPSTDQGVYVQLAVVAVVGFGAIVALRHRPNARLLATGAVVLAFAGLGLRTLH